MSRLQEKNRGSLSRLCFENSLNSQPFANRQFVSLSRLATVIVIAFGLLACSITPGYATTTSIPLRDLKASRAAHEYSHDSRFFGIKESDILKSIEVAIQPPKPTPRATNISANGYGNDKDPSYDHTTTKTSTTTTTTSGYKTLGPSRDVEYKMVLHSSGPAVLDSAIIFTVELIPQVTNASLTNWTTEFIYQWMNMANRAMNRTEDFRLSRLPMTFFSKDVSAGKYPMTVAAFLKTNPARLVAFSTQIFVLTEKLNGQLFLDQDLSYQRFPHVFATNKKIRLRANVHDHFHKSPQPTFEYFWYKGGKFIARSNQPYINTKIQEARNITVKSVIYLTFMDKWDELDDNLLQRNSAAISPLKDKNSTRITDHSSLSGNIHHKLRENDLHSDNKAISSLENQNRVSGNQNVRTRSTVSIGDQDSIGGDSHNTLSPEMHHGSVAVGGQSKRVRRMLGKLKGLRYRRRSDTLNSYNLAGGDLPFKKGDFDTPAIFKDELTACKVERMDKNDDAIQTHHPATLQISCVGSPPIAICTNATHRNSSIEDPSICKPGIFLNETSHRILVYLNSTGWQDVHFYIFNDVSRVLIVKAFYGYTPNNYSILPLTLPVIFGLLGFSVLLIGAIYIMRLRKKPLIEVADFDFHPTLTSKLKESNSITLSRMFNSLRYFLSAKEKAKDDYLNFSREFTPTPTEFSPTPTDFSRSPLSESFKSDTEHVLYGSL